MTPTESPATRHARARNAAPELLRALDGLYYAVDARLDPDQLHHFMARAREAIVFARGGPVDRPWHVEGL